MPLGKRKLAALFSRSTMRAAKRTSVGYSKYAKRMMGRVGARHMVGVKPLGIRVRKLERMVETKESGNKTGTNVGLLHNTPTVVFDLFENIGRGVEDPMGPSANSTARIGDKITIKGVLIRGMLETAVARSRVHFHLYVVKGAKGDVFDAGTMYKGMAGNKMIDQFNTERFTIVAQKRITINVGNQPANTLTLAAEPQMTFNTQTAGQGAQPFKMYIPGYKFCKNGNLIYENNSNQPKFFDYKFFISAYDWFGTPETSNVGKINEIYHKVYFSDL